MLQTVAIRTPKHLCIKDNALVIREKKSSEVIGKIALSDIWVIIIDNPQVTMTSALMSGINKAGIGVLYCGSDHMPNGLALPLGAHSRHAEIVEHQLAILSCALATRLKLKKSAAMPRKSKATTRQIAKALPQVNTSRHFYPTGHVGMAL